MPKISVIIPVYNSEKYLRECLDSVLNQTLKDIEIICVNDGSTDHSLDILKEYEKADERVSIISQLNINAGAARNHGLKYAHGEYFSFLDSDDFFELDMLEKAYAKAVECDADIVVFRSNQYLNDQHEYRNMDYTINNTLLPKDKEVFSGSDIERNVFGTFIGWAWDKLFRAQFVIENRITFQEQRSTNDLAFVYSAIAVADRIVTLDEVLAHYRLQNDNAISSTREKSWFCFYTALLALRVKLIEYDLFERFEQDYVNYCTKTIVWNYSTLSEPTKSFLQYMLRYSWAEELGIFNFSRNYYYDSHEYEELLTILDVSREDNQGEENFYISEIEQLKTEIAVIKSTVSWKLGRFLTWLPRKIRGGVRCIKTRRKTPDFSHGECQ